MAFVVLSMTPLEGGLVERGRGEWSKVGDLERDIVLSFMLYGDSWLNSGWKHWTFMGYKIFFLAGKFRGLCRKYQNHCMAESGIFGRTLIGNESQYISKKDISSENISNCSESGIFVEVITSEGLFLGYIQSCNTMLKFIKRDHLPYKVLQLAEILTKYSRFSKVNLCQKFIIWACCPGQFKSREFHVTTDQKRCAVANQEF